MDSRKLRPLMAGLFLSLASPVLAAPPEVKPKPLLAVITTSTGILWLVLISLAAWLVNCALVALFNQRPNFPPNVARISAGFSAVVWMFLFMAVLLVYFLHWSLSPLIWSVAVLVGIVILVAMAASRRQTA